jgi:hypothetical protein
MSDIPGVDSERGREAMAHLQTAALEFIQAARVILDVAEEAVREPGGVAAIVTETLAAFAAMAGTVSRKPTADDGEEPPGVEHIRIS